MPDELRQMTDVGRRRLSASALADELLRHAEDAPDPRPLIQAARVLLAATSPDRPATMPQERADGSQAAG
jgi:hypothetical protein